MLHIYIYIYIYIYDISRLRVKLNISSCQFKRTCPETRFRNPLCDSWKPEHFLWPRRTGIVAGNSFYKRITLKKHNFSACIIISVCILNTSYKKFLVSWQFCWWKPTIKQCRGYKIPSLFFSCILRNLHYNRSIQWISWYKSLFKVYHLLLMLIQADGHPDRAFGRTHAMSILSALHNARTEFWERCKAWNFNSTGCRRNRTRLACTFHQQEWFVPAWRGNQCQVCLTVRVQNPFCSVHCGTDDMRVSLKATPLVYSNISS